MKRRITDEAGKADAYSCDRCPEVPYLDAQAVLCDDGSVTVFAINRSLTDEPELQATLPKMSWNVIRLV